MPVRRLSLVYRRAIVPFFLSLISLRQKPYRAATARRELPVAALALAGFLPERTGSVPVRELNYDPHMRKMVAPTAFFFGSVFFAILAVYFMRPESENVPVFMAVLAAICFVTALSLWTKTRKEKAGRPQVITRSLKFKAQGGIDVHVDVQFRRRVMMAILPTHSSPGFRQTSTRQSSSTSKLTRMIRLCSQLPSRM